MPTLVVGRLDLPVPGGSLAADLAAAGFDVYVVDARGYGGSTRMAAMAGPPQPGSTLGRSAEIVRDIGAVATGFASSVAAALRCSSAGPPAATGWVTTPASIRIESPCVVMLNALYGGTPTHPTLGRGSDLNDFWSRPEDLEILGRHLVHARAKLVTIPDGTHFVHLDRPERGRARLLEKGLAFVRGLAH